MNLYDVACEALPENLKNCYSCFRNENPEEIRLRLGRSPTVLKGGKEVPVRARMVEADELMCVMEKLTGASISAYISQLREGYLNYRGLRVGFCARALNENGRINYFTDLTSLSIRLPTAVIPELEQAAKQICQGKIANTLIVSPPGLGKTSLLRALICHVSNLGFRVSVIDERNELSAVYNGQAYFDLGEHTDTMVGIKKQTCAMMLLRGMNPQLIALDEISEEEDMDTIYQIIGCGVTIFATAHGESLNQLKKRPAYQRILRDAVFEKLVFIECINQKRKYTCTELNG